MKKYFLVLLFLLYFPFSASALSNTDLYTQQHIADTYITSGYADILLQKNAKNVLMEVLYHQITDYIFENTDPVTANRLSIYMPNNLQECDDEYADNLYKEVDLNYADTVLNICREDVYTRNLEYLLKETAVVSKGSYYILLENIFKNHTKEILNIKEFTMDKFINILAVNNLMGMDGYLFFDKQKNTAFENIKCENNHAHIPVINQKTNKIMDNITINDKNLYIHACIVKNRQNFFKYILLYEKTGSSYTLYARLPLYNHFIKRDTFKREHEVLYADIKNNIHLILKEPVASKSYLTFDYLVLKKGIHLASYTLSSNKKTEVIYYDKNMQAKYTPENLSLKLYKKLLYDHCINNSSICNTDQIEYLLNMTNTQHYK